MTRHSATLLLAGHMLPTIHERLNFWQLQKGITDSRVTGCAMPGILVTSTAGLQMGWNILERWIKLPRLPSEKRKADLTKPKPIIDMNSINCTK